MSARDDYPATVLLSGRASVYDRLWTEIDHLRYEVRRLRDQLERSQDQAREACDSRNVGP